MKLGRSAINECEAKNSREPCSLGRVDENMNVARVMTDKGYNTGLSVVITRYWLDCA